MNVRLTHNAYGKHNVRVSKIKRSSADPSEHRLIEASIDVELQGELDDAYTQGDNSNIVATDTCKNTVYVLAKDDPFETIESFGLTVAKHFLKQYTHLSAATVWLRQHLWQRLLDCPHGFLGSDAETPTARICLQRDQPPQITSGVDQLMVAKTTQSGFANFHRDEFRTLPDTDDRILATSVKAEWAYSSAELDFEQQRRSIRNAMLECFIDHYSRSVQETMMRMGSAAIESCTDIDSITLTMPNKHHILFNLEPFGRENNNDVFVVTDDPYGYITATVTRE